MNTAYGDRPCRVCGDRIGYHQPFRRDDQGVVAHTRCLNEVAHLLGEWDAERLEVEIAAAADQRADDETRWTEHDHLR